MCFLGCGFRIQGLRFRVLGMGFEVHGIKYRVVNFMFCVCRGFKV
jgi:hypothetical protein